MQINKFVFECVFIRSPNGDGDQKVKNIGPVLRIEVWARVRDANVISTHVEIRGGFRKRCKDVIPQSEVRAR